MNLVDTPGEHVEAFIHCFEAKSIYLLFLIYIFVFPFSEMPAGIVYTTCYLITDIQRDYIDRSIFTKEMNTIRCLHGARQNFIGNLTFNS